MNLQHVVFAEGKFWIQNPINGELTPIQFGNMGGGTRKIIQQVGSINVESGELIRLSTDGSGDEVVPTIKKAKIIFFTSQNTDQSVRNTASFGKSNQINNDCICTSTIDSAEPPFQISSFNHCILVKFQGSSEGYGGRVLVINNNSYTIRWTASPNGIDMKVRWHAITE